MTYKREADLATFEIEEQVKVNMYTAEQRMTVVHSEHVGKVSRLESAIDFMRATARNEILAEANSVQDSSRVWETKLNCQICEASELLAASRDRDRELRSELMAARDNALSRRELDRQEADQQLRLALSSAEAHSDRQLSEALEEQNQRVQAQINEWANDFAKDAAVETDALRTKLAEEVQEAENWKEESDRLAAVPIAPPPVPPPRPTTQPATSMGITMPASASSAFAPTRPASPTSDRQPFQSPLGWSTPVRGASGAAKADGPAGQTS